MHHLLRRVLVLAVLLSVVSTVPASNARAEDTIFVPVADAYGKSDEPDRNFNTVALYADQDPDIVSFLYFEVGGLPGPVATALLRLYVGNPTNDAPTLHLADPFVEQSISWNVQPGIGLAIADVGPAASGSWIEYDLTGYVVGDASYAFALVSTSTDSISVDSRSGANPPQLLVSTLDLTPTEVPPTATEVPPTATEVPPTATEVPPTATEVPPTATASAVPTKQVEGVVAVTPNADGYVIESQPLVAFNTRALWMDADDIGGSRLNAFLRFRVTGINGPVTAARLRLYVINGSVNGPALHVTDSDWTEGGLTWGTQPPPGALLAERESVALGWVEYDVAAAVTGDGTYAFAILPQSADSMGSSSREGANPPQLVVEYGRGGPDPTPTPTAVPTPTTTATPPGGEAVTVVAAGDIACDPASGGFNGGDGTSSSCHMRQTAALVSDIDPDVVLMLGDSQYEQGTRANHDSSYNLHWGAFKGITYAVAGGSHDSYGGGEWYSWWGERAGRSPSENWYSSDVGSWHIVVLNSYCRNNGNCDEMEAWLRSDLEANPNACTLVAWHEPRYSSGYRHGNEVSIDWAWDILADSGVELLLTAHEHNYERFAPMDRNGQASATGLRQFVVGTGGKSLESAWGTIQPNSEVRNRDTFGVLQLTLLDGSYSWTFVPEAGDTFTDAGTGSCH